jgi:hypothetical protein
MPFEEDDDKPERVQNKQLKKVSSQKSIFDDVPKKVTQEEFERKVKKVVEQNSAYKQKAAEYATLFKKILSDRTLSQNKNVFALEMETELLSNMIELSVNINNDPNEKEGMGSLMWIILLFKACLSQRDRINKLEYVVSQLEKKLEPSNFQEIIFKEIKVALDKPEGSG